MLNENHLIKDNIRNLRLLTESVDQKSIVDAIKGKDIIYIYYQGDDTEGQHRGYRTIEPFAYGKSAGKNSDKILLRAWQQAGASQSNTKRDGATRSGWRLFDVAGISSWLPTGEKFIASEGKLSEFNPNDSQMLSSPKIVAYDDNEIPTNDTSGQDSIEEPNFNSTQSSAFSTENSKFQYDKTITHLFGKEKWSGKRNPANFTVVRDKNGKLINKHNGTLRREIESGIANPKDVIGNLEELFKDISGLQDTKKISKGQFEDFQNKLNNSGSLLGGERSKPIDQSFFNKQKLEFERNLQNN